MLMYEADLCVVSFQDSITIIIKLKIIKRSDIILIEEREMKFIYCNSIMWIKT